MLLTPIATEARQRHLDRRRELVDDHNVHFGHSEAGVSKSRLASSSPLPPHDQPTSQVAVEREVVHPLSERIASAT